MLLRAQGYGWSALFCLSHKSAHLLRGGYWQWFGTFPSGKGAMPGLRRYCQVSPCGSLAAVCLSVYGREESVISYTVPTYHKLVASIMGRKSSVPNWGSC